MVEPLSEAEERSYRKKARLLILNNNHLLRRGVQKNALRKSAFYHSSYVKKEESKGEERKGEEESKGEKNSPSRGLFSKIGRALPPLR